MSTEQPQGRNSLSLREDQAVSARSLYLKISSGWLLACRYEFGKAWLLSDLVGWFLASVNAGSNPVADRHHNCVRV